MMCFSKRTLAYRLAILIILSLFSVMKNQIDRNVARKDSFKTEQITKTLKGGPPIFHGLNSVYQDCVIDFVNSVQELILKDIQILTNTCQRIHIHQ